MFASSVQCQCPHYVPTFIVVAGHGALHPLCQQVWSELLRLAGHVAVTGHVPVTCSVVHSLRLLLMLMFKEGKRQKDSSCRAVYPVYLVYQVYP